MDASVPASGLCRLRNTSCQVRILAIACAESFARKVEKYARSLRIHALPDVLRGFSQTLVRLENRSWVSGQSLRAIPILRLILVPIFVQRSSSCG
jgi:hypothetical protein